MSDNFKLTFGLYGEEKLDDGTAADLETGFSSWLVFFDPLALKLDLFFQYVTLMDLILALDIAKKKIMDNIANFKG